MPKDDFVLIDNEDVFYLDETPLNHKRRKSNVVDDSEQAMVNSEYHSEISRSSR
jgi:hypothetical protein